MPGLTDGQYLNQYVAPQLLQEFKNYNAKFMAALQPAPKEALDADGIRFNKLINNVGFHVNNTNAFVAKKMTGKKTLVEWDKLDTDPTEIDTAEIRYLNYDKNSAVRVKHSQAFKLGLRDYVAHKLAPSANVSGAMPVLTTTGAEINGRKRLTFADLLNFYSEIELLSLMSEDGVDQTLGLNLILNKEHRADLLIDKAGTSNHRDNLEFNKATGEISRFYKFQVWENNDTPLYSSTGQLKARNSIKEDGDQYASVFFYAPNTVYHLEKLLILHKPLIEDTNSADPKSEIRLHGYGLCDKVQEYGFGALVSSNA